MAALLTAHAAYQAGADDFRTALTSAEFAHRFGTIDVEHMQDYVCSVHLALLRTRIARGEMVPVHEPNDADSVVAYGGN